MAEGAQGRKDVEKFGPRFSLLGYVSGGHRAHRQITRGVIRGALRTPKGVCVRMSKNLREQFQPMNRGQPANARQHIFKLKGFGEKAVCACVDARLSHFRVSVRTHDQNL